MLQDPCRLSPIMLSTFKCLLFKIISLLSLKISQCCVVNVCISHQTKYSLSVYKTNPKSTFYLSFQRMASNTHTHGHVAHISTSTLRFCMGASAPAQGPPSTTVSINAVVGRGLCGWERKALEGKHNLSENDDLWYFLDMAAFIDKGRIQYSASRTLTKLLDHKRISPSRLVKAVSMCHCLIKMLESRCKSEKYKMTRRQAKKMRMILNTVWKVCLNSSMLITLIHTGGGQDSVPLGDVAFSYKGLEEVYSYPDGWVKKMK